MNKTILKVVDYTIISTVFLLLFIFIILCILKLHVFFNSNNYLSKKIISGNETNIANISFYKFYYNKKYNLQGVIIEHIIIFIMILLTLLAYIGFVMKNNINHGYLNYYYGDIDEYSAINNFIILIIIVCIIYCFSYLYWFINDKDDDDKLNENEKNLRSFIIDNLDKDYLNTLLIGNVNKEGDTSLFTKYVSSLTDINGDPPVFLFKLCFTYHIMTNSKFKYISNDIRKIYNVNNFTLTSSSDDKKKITDELLKNIDIIANYDHSNNIALPKLKIMINAINANVSANLNIKDRLNLNEEQYETINSLYDDANKNFTNTIESFKAIHDKYYRYYMISIFITNIIVSYAIIIFIYFIIRIKVWSSRKKDIDYDYSVYDYKSFYNSYIKYLLVIYYFITCPIIIFSI
jgi:hypothetical protein